jgi:hypothetical protein
MTGSGTGTKAFEDSKNEPGAANFYYGEMVTATCSGRLPATAAHPRAGGGEPVWDLPEFEDPAPSA